MNRMKNKKKKYDPLPISQPMLPKKYKIIRIALVLLTIFLLISISLLVYFLAFYEKEKTGSHIFTNSYKVINKIDVPYESIAYT